jgi:hypothetical protein
LKRPRRPLIKILPYQWISREDFHFKQGICHARTTADQEICQSAEKELQQVNISIAQLKRHAGDQTKERVLTISKLAQD